MLKNYQGFLSAKPAVATVHTTRFFQFSCITGLPAIYHLNAFRVGRYGKGYCIFLVILPHCHRRHDQMLMGIHRPRLVRLRSGNINAFGVLFHHMQIHIRILLFSRRKAPVSLGIRHGPIHCQIFFLYFFHKGNKVLMIIGMVLLIYLKGRGINRIKGIHTNTPLKTGSGLLS